MCTSFSCLEKGSKNEANVIVRGFYPKGRTAGPDPKGVPFGEVFSEDTDPDGDGVNVEQPFRFPGQYEDIETDIYYNYFRDYDPQLGRYVEADPIGLNHYYESSQLIISLLIGTISDDIYYDRLGNLFNYVDYDPVSWFDPAGLKKGKNKGGASQAPRKDKKKGADARQPSGDRERNIKHPEGEEHSRNPKGKGSYRSESCEGCEEAATVILTGGTIYFLYRCGRMLPSLLPPLWWTIPGNLALP